MCFPLARHRGRAAAAAALLALLLAEAPALALAASAATASAASGAAFAATAWAVPVGGRLTVQDYQLAGDPAPSTLNLEAFSVWAPGARVETRASAGAPPMIRAPQITRCVRAGGVRTHQAAAAQLLGLAAAPGRPADSPTLKPATPSRCGIPAAASSGVPSRAAPAPP